MANYQYKEIPFVVSSGVYEMTNNIRWRLLVMSRVFFSKSKSVGVNAWGVFVG